MYENSISVLNVLNVASMKKNTKILVFTSAWYHGNVVMCYSLMIDEESGMVP